MDPRTVSAAIGLVQQVIKIGKKATNLQYEEALLAAREALFAQKEDNLKLSEENIELKQKLKSNDESEELSKHVKLSGGAYWREDNNKWIGPNCTACWVDRRKLVHLDHIRLGSVQYQCPSCKAQYGHLNSNYIDES